MKTEDIIKELELNYGYTFAKEGTDNKWQFEWICEMINDVQNVVTKNCNLNIVSSRLSFARFVAKNYDIRTDDNRNTYAEIATGDNYTESEIYKKWQLLNGC